MRLVMMTVGILIAGCHGPLTKPMVDRLDDETQKKVDDAWVNMFSPPDRLERTLLLDCVLCSQLHQFGVDRLQLVSEKDVKDGRVVMEVRFDREAPEFDEFTMTYLDGGGHEVRRERFARDEIQDRVEFLLSAEAVTDEMDTELREGIEQRTAEREARLAEIRAALGPLQPQPYPPVIHVHEAGPEESEEP